MTLSRKTQVDRGMNSGFLGIQKTKKIQVRFLTVAVGLNQESPKILRVIILYFLKIMVSLLLLFLLFKNHAFSFLLRYNLIVSIPISQSFKGLYFTKGFHIHYLI